MRKALYEFAALGAVLAAVGVPSWAVVRFPVHHPGEPRVITLTGVKKDGAWTDEVVDGTNYWRKTFRKATPVLRQGEEVVLRLESADVRHGFYAPELGIGPLSIDPGHVVEVRVRPEKIGEFGYWCTEVCGHCHYQMKGVIRVVGPNEPIVLSPSELKPCNHAFVAPSAPPKTLVERGEAIFREKNCFTCHGEKGSGGVRNPNYLAGNVPQNNLLAEKMGLFDRDDAAKAIELLEKRANLDELVANPPFAKYGQFLAQYHATHNLILNGNKAGKKDAASFAPPLNMPSWRYHLSDDDVDAAIAFLLSQYPWSEDE